MNARFGLSLVSVLGALWCLGCGGSKDKTNASSSTSSTSSASAPSATISSSPHVASSSASSASSAVAMGSNESPSDGVEDVPPVLRRPSPPSSATPTATRGPRVVVAPIVSEEMDTAEREAIELALRKNESRFVGCYQKGLAKEATLEGTLGARVSIGPSGNVVKKLGTTLRDEETVSCVLGELKSMIFPLPQKRAPVVVPLKFER